MRDVVFLCGNDDAEIMGVCGVNRYTWARLAIVLEDLLSGLDGLVNFHHQSLDDAVIARYMPTEEQRQKVTVALIALFRDAH
ncbi:hypothetical protein T484DRAFT_1818606 [Baffinella frigidus]|nr:hypothetical protein T484DRAFT_1818606 [Cryptophyta sp. CCMP2293]